MISDDKYVEMIIAGVNRLSMPGADVEWNSKREGRQFDVLATLSTGLHRVILAFEVKHKKRPISVDLIEAFVTKANDAHANKAIFVSTAGYQSGCMKVAESHGIDLFKLTFVEDHPLELPPEALLLRQATGSGAVSPPVVEDQGSCLGNSIETVTLHYMDGSTVSVPDEPSQMRYYLEKTKALSGASLLEMLEPHATNPKLEEGNRLRHSVEVNMHIYPPDDYFLKVGELDRMEFEIVARRGRLIGGNVEIEPSSFATPVRYENVVTGESYEGDLTDLPLGGNELEVGKFYFLYHPLRYFYCEGMSGDLMKLRMVESFQCGDLYQSLCTQETKYGPYYIPVDDKTIISRLEKRLLQMRFHKTQQLIERISVRRWGNSA